MTGARRPGEVSPRSLTGTRRHLHHAALLAAAVGRSLAAPQAGFRHAALYWDGHAGVLAGWPVVRPDGSSVRIALAFEPPAVLLLGEHPRPSMIASVELPGVAFAEAWSRLGTVVAAAGLDAGQLVLRRPVDLPSGPISTAEPFLPDAAAAAELGRWFAFADRYLNQAARAHDIVLPIPCWPDHFDLAVVVRVDGPPAPADAQVTLGFSPGDATITEPYFYVTAWPVAASRVAQVPPPAGARWQIDGWTGLALSATSLLAAEHPGRSVTAFLARGFEIARDLAGAA